MYTSILRVVVGIQIVWLLIRFIVAMMLIGVGWLVIWEEGGFYSLSTLANLVNIFAYSFFSFSCDSLTTFLQTVT